MYHDEIFENALKDVREESYKALKEVREESYKALKEEISSMESTIERFIRNILECTSSKSERDFNVQSL